MNALPAGRRARVGAKPSRRGFTLVEMIVVVSIMALLVGIAIPVVGASLRIAESSSTKERMQGLATGITNFFEDTDKFPNTLGQLVSPGGKVTGWAGPYVNEGFGGTKDNIFYDAWQNAFQYLAVDASTIRLRSWGSNGIDESGGGDDIDLDVNVSTLLRKKNDKLLSEINTAIKDYNASYRVTRLPPMAATGQTITDDPSGHWHTHRYIFKGNWTSHTHRHSLSLVHSVKDLHPGEEDKVADEPSVLDVPLRGPWAYTLGLLELRGLLDDSEGRYSTDAWGNSFVTGPDPVQYVTSSGAN